MLKTSNSHRLTARPAALIALTTLAIGAFGTMAIMGGADDRGRELTIEDRLLPAYEIIRFGELPNGVGRLDTATGEIWRFHGDLRKPNVRSQWVKTGGVPGVTKRPVGTLQLQEAAGALFLVDLLNGDTWILKDRGTGFAWDPVTVIR